MPSGRPLPGRANRNDGVAVDAELAERGELDEKIGRSLQAARAGMWAREHVFVKPRERGRRNGLGENRRRRYAARVAAGFTHRIRVRYGECDPQGVVFNANYLMYFDVALTELWREAIGSYTDMIESGTDMVVAEARCRYLAPAGFDDELDVHIEVARLGTTGLTTRMEVGCGATTVVEGEMRHVFIDPATKAKKPIPSEIRAALARYCPEEQEASTGRAAGETFAAERR